MTAPVNPTMMYSTTLSDSQTHPTTGMTQSSPLVDQMDGVENCSVRTDMCIR